MIVRILFIGDIVGRPGRELVRQGLQAIVEHHQIDLVIANAENSAAGFGITREIGDQLLDWGVDVMTSGNHIWDKKEALDYIGAEPRLLRPANYPAGAPGKGSYLARTRDGRTAGVVGAPPRCNSCKNCFVSGCVGRISTAVWASTSACSLSPFR